MAKRFIDVDKSIAEIDKGELLVGNNAEWAKEILLRMPTADVVEVVRCKDCRHFEYSQINNRGLRICQASKMDITENDFCSYGERKEND